ncbi:ubiquitin carboxyl-terminal hydrolase [Calliopsis andreniformis]|uniref:ubiquitin carboxyl-terminal hydrolase n=1 Tax=Calliopsis andreniformis TaxID=337506 RepID=UPI003FCC757B
MTSWIPLESNPEVMSKLLHKLGVPKEWCIVDIYSLDSDLLALIPKPVLAVIVLYPLRKEEVQEDSENKKDDDKSILVPADNQQTGCTDPAVYHMKQYIHNACGTIALIHSVANNLETINLQEGFLKTFLDDSKNLPFMERGELLMNSYDISVTHKELAQEGQTQAPSEETPVYHHFVALIHKNGFLYELDGRKSAPINHGSTSPETFLNDAARLCKKYVERNPYDLDFTVVALVKDDTGAF